MQIKIIKRSNPVTTYEEWCHALQEVPEGEQASWIRTTLQYKSNLHIFGRYFFPHLIRSAEPVPECHISLIEEMSRQCDSAIIFPRGFAKSTWEKIDTIHDVVYKHENVILYISDTMASAQLHFEHIKSEFESNEALLDVFGDLVPTMKAKRWAFRWNSRRLSTTNGVHIIARGRGKGRGVNIDGKRPSKIIFDDVEDDQEVKSPEQRQKVHDWIYNVIFPSRDKSRCKIKFIGTVISPLAEVLAFYKKHGGIFRKAIENGKSIWPSYFSLEYLDNLKNDIGTRAFMQEYMNAPMDDGLAIIKPEWISENYYTVLQNKSELQKVIVLDPQAGEKKGSDYYGLSVVGRYKGSNHRYFLRVLKGKASQLEQAALLVRTYQEEIKEGQVISVGVEKLMTQVAVYQLILDWKAEIGRASCRERV